MVRRVRKRFVSLLYMTVLGSAFLLMGDWFLLPCFFAVGNVCELILWSLASYGSNKKITAAWTVCSILYIGINLLPLCLFWYGYEQNALAGGMKQECIGSYDSYCSELITGLDYLRKIPLD
jgi:energy-coupling factor transport system substrate-specific component